MPKDSRAALSLVGSIDPTGSAGESTAPALTDIGNGQRFAAQHGEDVRFCADYNKFFCWSITDVNDRPEEIRGPETEEEKEAAAILEEASGEDKTPPPPADQLPSTTGGLWRIDNTGEVMRRAKSAAENIYNERDIPNRAWDDTLKWAKASQEESSLKSMLSLAKSEWPIPVTPEAFDRDPWLLNVRNGTIDLRDGTFREARREDLITQMAGTWYDPRATCETFTTFLKSILPDPEVQEFIRRMLAYCLTGTVNNPRALFILCGRGLNGKTTLIETMRRLLGSYAWTTPVETLLAKNSNQIPNDIAALKGRRMVTASETDADGKLSFSKLKRMSGDSILVGRKMRAEFEEFAPTFKLVLDTNHAPDTSRADQAFFDRLKLVPFPVRIENPDPNMKEMLCRELPGILNWILAPEGLQEWREHGLGDAPAVTEASRALRQEQDRIGRFLEEYYVEDINGEITVAELHGHYKAVMQEGNEFVLGKTIFGSRMRDRGFNQEHNSRGTARVWKGLRRRSDGGMSPADLERERERQRLEDEKRIADSDPLFQVGKRANK